MQTSQLSSYLLAPFFLLMLVVAQLRDLGRFGLARLSDFWSRVYERVSELIDSLPLTLRSKYTLMVTAGWLSTGVLVVILLAVVIGWWWSENHIRVIAQPDGSLLTIGERGDVMTVHTQLPPEIQLASNEAIIMADDEDLIALVAQASQLTLEQQQTLSQREKINLALGYYYLGSQQWYDYWLEQARAMDPNAEIFRADR